MNKQQVSTVPLSSDILVVDDEPDIRNLVQEILEDEGYRVRVAQNGEDARHEYNQQHPDLILLDIWMPDIDGISLLKEWISLDGLNTPVIMMSGHGTVETAVEATRLGAFDFIEKPLSLAKLLLTVQQALEQHPPSTSTPERSHHIAPEPIGKSLVMQNLREQLKRIAEHDSWVLLNGEAGCGTKVAANYLHRQSKNNNKNFVEINFTFQAIHIENDSEQNIKQKITVKDLKRANGGTLFLHNIDDADKLTQEFLLSNLKDPSFDAWVIASTHNNLEQMIESNKFNKDLFYLLNIVPLYIPPLRDHREDVPDLLNYYTNYYIDTEKLPYRHFSLAAQNRLRNYDWFGNIRELTNMIQHLLVTAEGSEITLDEVETAITQQENQFSITKNIPVAFELPLREAREKFEHDYLVHHLQKNDGSVGKVAKLIGMERTHLYRKLRSLKIDPKNIIMQDNKK